MKQTKQQIIIYYQERAAAASAARRCRPCSFHAGDKFAVRI